MKKPYIEVTVAGIPLREFGAKMQSYPEFVTAIETEIFQGAARSTITALKNRRKAMQMHCYIDFFGDNPTRTRQNSAFEALFLGLEPVEIDIGDGFFYRAFLTSSKESKTKGETVATHEFYFRVTRHTEPVSVEVVSYDMTYNPDGGIIFCQSNVERTDCILTIGQPYSGVNLLQVYLGDQRWSYQGEVHESIVLDGIHKMLLIDGENATNDITWTDFPYLVPGENRLTVEIAASATLQHPCRVEYTPTYL